MRFLSGFIAGASCGMVAGAWIGALLTAAAIETIGRALTIGRPNAVEVEDLMEAWASNR